MAATTETIEKVKDIDAGGDKYKYGFVTEIEMERAPKGLSEEVIRFISAKKDEPEWLLEKRLEAYAHWQDMADPDWAKLNIPPIDYNGIYYYAAPKSDDDKPNALIEKNNYLLRAYAY